MRLALLADRELDGRAIKSLAEKLSHDELEELRDVKSLELALKGIQSLQACALVALAGGHKVTGRKALPR